MGAATKSGSLSPRRFVSSKLHRRQRPWRAAQGEAPGDRDQL